MDKKMCCISVQERDVDHSPPRVHLLFLLHAFPVLLSLNQPIFKVYPCSFLDLLQSRFILSSSAFNLTFFSLLTRPVYQTSKLAFWILLNLSCILQSKKNLSKCQVLYFPNLYLTQKDEDNDLKTHNASGLVESKMPSTT